MGGIGYVARILKTKIDDYITALVQSRINYSAPAQMYSPPGDDSPPLPDDKAFIVKKDGSGRFVVLGTLAVSGGAEAGEKILFSRDSDGATKAKIYLKADGTISVNGGSTKTARNGDPVQVTIPANSFIVSVSGGKRSASGWCFESFAGNC
jgi:hypothetical protein